MHSNHNIPENRKTFQEKLDANQIPQTSSSAFEKDAFEGWKSSALSTDALKNLDRKFKPKKTPYIYIGIISVSILVFLFVFTNKAPQEKNIQSAITIPYKNTPSNIDTRNQDTIVRESNTTQITKTTKIVKPHQIIAQQTELKVEQNNPESEIVYLPIRKGNTINTNEKQFLLAKEIYFYDFKMIDYRAYRSNDENNLKNFELSGLPADKEKYSEGNETEGPKTYVVTYTEYLKKTMELFKKEKYEQASKRFEIILNTYPKDLNASFYGGMSYYNLGQYEKAYALFQNASSIGMSNFNEEAEWYSAKSLIEKGDLAKAKEILKKIASQKGFYAKQAEKLLSSL
jgi:TolA-binding protein